MLGVFSNVVGYTQANITFLYTIYPLLTLLVIYPYFGNKNKYLILLIIFGILTDLTYSNTLILNTCLFYMIYKINQTFHFFFPYNLLTTSISSLIGIYIYHVVTFLFLILINFNNYNPKVLLTILLSSTIMTIIYTIITYLLVNFLKQRLELKEVK